MFENQMKKNSVATNGNHLRRHLGGPCSRAAIVL